MSQLVPAHVNSNCLSLLLSALQANYFWAMVGNLGLSILLQIIFTIIQHRRRGMNELVKELAFVVVGMKAPRDAYKVAMGLSQEKGAIVSVISEMSACKCIELVAEGIPSGE